MVVAHKTKMGIRLGVAGLLPFLALTIALPGCTRHDKASVNPEKSRRREAAGPPVELILYCGAGIRNGAEPLIRAFERKYAGTIRLRVTYAGSGRLLGQISAVRRGDLYMPGAELYVKLAVEKGLAFPETRRIVAWFVPVIFVTKGNPRHIQSLRDLARPGLRLGLGDPRSCAIGRRTRKIFLKNHIPLERVAANVVFRSATVNELPLAVQMGSIDAAIVWDANARQFQAHGDTIPIPPEQNLISAIPIVVLRCSEHPEAARKFAEFAVSAKARRLLTAAGYTVNPPRTGGKAQAAPVKGALQK